MEYTHDPKQAEDYAHKVLKRLAQDGLPATPDFFELWYVYFSRQNQDVRDELDQLQKSKTGVTKEGCLNIFTKYLAKDRNEEAVRKAGEQINATIRDMTGVVHDVKDATSEYSGKLGGVNDKISSIKDTTELQAILHSMMSDTKGMLAQNQKLEQQLDQSSLVMENLQRDLETFRREALTDGLTGLANRKAFDTEVERIVREAEESGSPFTLMMGDIDHFKNFNDNYGHQVGDQVLRLVAKTLTDGVKGRDLVCRYGGEEFVILLPDTNLTAGVIVGNALRKAVATKDVVNRNSGQKMGRITMSLGVGEHVPGETIEHLIERADAALYTAKHNGRNQVAAAPTPSKV